MLSNFLRKILSLLSFWSLNDLSYIKNKDEKILKIIEKKLNSIHFNKKYLKKTHNIFNKKILNLLKNRKLTNFLRENFIQKMFFVHNRLFILKELLELKKDKNWILYKKLIEEDNVGNPVRYFLYPKSSGNRINHVYHLSVLTKEFNINLKKLNNVFEFGGGYGCMARIFSKINKRTAFTCFDTNIVNLLQYYYLKQNNLDVGFSKKNKILLCVDNTFASPYLQRPLELGADIIIHSATKYIAGHSDVIIGAIVINNKRLYERLSFIQNASGATPGPMDSFLTLRGIKTLHLRMQRHSENAKKIAYFLKRNPKIGKVYWPGFSDHTNHKIAKKQMKDFGGIVSFIPKQSNFKTAKKIAENLKLFTVAVSLGGVESLCCHPASMTHASISPEDRKKSGLVDSLLRLSIGIEDVDDLIDDLKQAIG